MKIEIIIVLIIIGFTVAFSIQYTLNLILSELRLINKKIDVRDYNESKNNSRRNM